MLVSDKTCPNPQAPALAAVSLPIQIDDFCSIAVHCGVLHHWRALIPSTEMKLPELLWRVGVNHNEVVTTPRGWCSHVGGITGDTNRSPAEFYELSWYQLCCWDLWDGHLQLSPPSLGRATLGGAWWQWMGGFLAVGIQICTGNCIIS